MAIQGKQNVTFSKEKTSSFVKGNKRTLFSSTITTFFLALMALPVFSLQAQTAIGSAGGSAVSNTHIMSYTVGQIACSNATSANNRLTEGVQQPYTVENVSIPDIKTFDFEISVYPNPASHTLNLKRSQNDNTLQVELYSVGGQKLHSAIWQGDMLSLDLANLNAGIYCIRIFDQNGKQKVYRITKK